MKSANKGAMRVGVLSVSVVLVLAGCAQTRPQPADPWSTPAVSKPVPAEPKSTPKTAGPIVTPSNDSAGRVISVNPRGRYAVLGYAVGSVPAPDTRVFSYRGGFKVGELRITGPARENNTVADILVGECQAGDEIRKD